MTYEEAIDVGNALFDEYFPNAKGKTRTTFLNSLFDELTEMGALELEDTREDDGETEEVFGFDND